MSYVLEGFKWGAGDWGTASGQITWAIDWTGMEYDNGLYDLTDFQTALQGACEVPLAVMERCVEVISLAKTAVQYGNKNALSDGAAGAEFARAALRVASYNVKINLGSIKDAEYAKNARTRMDEMDYMGANAATWIDSRVNELWSQPTG